MRYVGYCEDHEMPFKRGDVVIVPKGTMVKRVGQPAKPTGRSLKIKVDHTLPGMNYPEGHPRHNRAYGVENPKVVWAGSGGYWAEADVNSVRKADE